MLRTAGTLLLVVGVMIAAGAGIRLGGSEYRLAVQDARSVLTDEPEAAAESTPAGARIRDWYAIAGGQFLLGMLVLVVGAVTARVGINRDRDGNGAAAEHDFEASLSSIGDAVAALSDRLDAGPMDEAKTEVERISNELVVPLIDARFALQRRFGLAGYAAVMGPLSGAERLLNRAWSTLVDGHLEEARASLAGATAELDSALETLQGLERSA
jgi:hypothetical protein